MVCHLGVPIGARLFLRGARRGSPRRGARDRSRTCKAPPCHGSRDARPTVSHRHQASSAAFHSIMGPSLRLASGRKPRQRPPRPGVCPKVYCMAVRPPVRAPPAVGADADVAVGPGTRCDWWMHGWNWASTASVGRCCGRPRRVAVNMLGACSVTALSRCVRVSGHGQHSCVSPLHPDRSCSRKKQLSGLG
jgi:hypothetical protein